MLSGAEDLVPVTGAGSAPVRYRPRTEAGFARITHVTGDGRRPLGGVVHRRAAQPLRHPPASQPDAGWADPAVITGPARAGSSPGCSAETLDPLGNRILYAYQPDRGRHRASVTCPGSATPTTATRPVPHFLVTVKIILSYEPRPDPFSDHRPGFELRTTQRAAAIETWTQAGTVLARRAELSLRRPAGLAAANAVSLLTRVTVTGFDAGAHRRRCRRSSSATPPGSPPQRRFQQLTGPSASCPRSRWPSPDSTSSTSSATGCPSILELNGTARYWRNRGDGEFDPPRSVAVRPRRVQPRRPRACSSRTSTATAAPTC